jgi:hypothetical protein
MIFAPRAVFRYPIEPAPPTAVLVDWFSQGWFSQGRFGQRWFRQTWLRVFHQGWCEEAESFAPAAIAGTLEQLLGLAALANPPVLTHPSIVLARIGQPTPSAADRERLWQAFRVPLFEQIIGSRGELLAAECEAHDGLHIETPGLAWAGYTVETEQCACGRATPRLAHPAPVERVRSVAAYAR